MFSAIYSVDAAAESLLDLARAFSPRVEIPVVDDLKPGAPRRTTPTTRNPNVAPVVLLDVSGLERLLGEPQTIGRELRQAAADRGLHVRVAVAATRTAALLLACDRPGLTVVAAGEEASALGRLPLRALEPVIAARRGCAGAAGATALQALTTLKRWGLKTLGELAALPAAELFERLGPAGLDLRRAARGEDERPLVPARDRAPYEATLALEWPIEGLEPLSFVLGRLLEPLCARLTRAECGAAVLHIRLRLVTREIWTRRLALPVPICDSRVLRTLVLLDLDRGAVPDAGSAAGSAAGGSSDRGSQPPDDWPGPELAAGIDEVTVSIEPAPDQIVQYSLLQRAQPSTGDLATLVARLRALVGEKRCGSPALVDSFQPGAFRMTEFVIDRGSAPTPGSGAGVLRLSLRTPALPRAPCPPGKQTGDSASVVLRRFRLPVPVRVTLDAGQPIRLMTDRRGLHDGRVDACAGPWRSSGYWWRFDPADPLGIRSTNAPGRWNRDEWDIALSDGAIYRIFHDRETDRWFVEGIVD